MADFRLGFGGTPQPAIKFGGLEGAFQSEESRAPQSQVLQSRFALAFLQPPISTRIAWFHRDPPYLPG